MAFKTSKLAKTQSMAILSLINFIKKKAKRVNINLIVCENLVLKDVDYS